MALSAESKHPSPNSAGLLAGTHLRLYFGLAGLFLVVYLVLGYYLIFIRNAYATDGLARLVSAWLVFQGRQVKLATIGFVWPPIPSLLIIPFAAIPAFVQSMMAPIIVSGLCSVFSLIILGYLSAACGINQRLQVLVILLFALNPLILIFAINGMSEAVLVVTSLAAVFWLVRFYQTDRYTHMILAGILFGLLPLIRYESILLSLWSCVLVLLLSWDKRHEMPLVKFRQFMEGRLLAYSSLVIYPTFLWMLANWLIMGNPLYFLTDVESATSILHIELEQAGVLTDPLSSFRFVFGAWGLMFPLGAVAVFALIFLGMKQRSNFLMGFGLMPLVVPFTQFILLYRQSTVPRIRYLIMGVPIGLAVALVAFNLLSPWIRRYRFGQAYLVAAFSLLFIFSNIMTRSQLVNYPLQDQEQKTWYGLAGGGEYQVKKVIEAFDLGRYLVGVIPSGSRVLIGLEDGFAVELGAGDPSLFMDHTDPDFHDAVLNPPAYVEYILVPYNKYKSGLNVINRIHKTLHDRGAPWVELVDGLPQTELEWKLYKVKRSSQPVQP